MFAKSLISLFEQAGSALVWIEDLEDVGVESAASQDAVLHKGGLDAKVGGHVQFVAQHKASGRSEREQAEGSGCRDGH